MDMTLQRYQ